MATVTHNYLAALPPDERDAALEAMEARLTTGAQPGPHDTATIGSRLRAFEQKYGMTTHEMHRRLSQGSLTENDDVASWLFWSEAYSSRVVR